MDVAAVIVTRGDVDLLPVVDSLPSKWEIVIWDNSKRKTDLAVYGRYAGIEETVAPLIYVQDDDVIVSDPERIAWESDSGGSAYGQLVCNMPVEFRHDFYVDHSLVGFGACFHRDLPKSAFIRFRTSLVTQPGLADGSLSVLGPTWFTRACDVVFTALTPHVFVDVPKSNMDYASAPNRMWKQPGHVSERSRILDLALQARDA